MLKGSMLATIIIMTVMILFLLNKFEVHKKNRLPIKYAPLEWSSNTGSSLQPLKVKGSKPEPKEFLNTSTSASLNSQPHVSNRSTTKLDAKGTMRKRIRPFLLVKNSTRDSTTELISDETTHSTVDNALLRDSSVSTHALVTEETHSTQSPIDNVLLKDSYSTPSLVNTVETMTTHENVLLKDSTVKSITTLVAEETRTTHSPVDNRFNESNKNSATRPTRDETMHLQFNAVSLFNNNNVLLNSSNKSSTANMASEEATTYDRNNAGTSFNQSFTDLLPRSVYFDSRRRDGYDNATVILVQVLKTILEEERVVGCGVDEHFTNQFLFKPLAVYTPYVHERFPWLTHDQAMLICYDLPAHQGSRAFVLYKDETGTTLKIEAEKRLYIPTGHKKVPVSPDNRRKSSLLVCITAYGTPPWVREWLVYQKTIGVDFIHIYAQESFITEGAVNNPVLQSYLKSGYAKLDVWKAFLNESQDYYHQQPLLYVDCIYRYRSEFDYALLYDFDDFFVPVIPGETDIHYYANRFFNSTIYNRKVAAVPFRWIAYYPDCGLTTKPEDIVNGNVTNHLAFNASDVKFIKSMYKLSAITEVQIHAATSFYPGYTRYAPSCYTRRPLNLTFCSFPPEIAYVAHIRKKKLPPAGKPREECERLKKISVF